MGWICNNSQRCCWPLETAISSLHTATCLLTFTYAVHSFLWCARGGRGKKAAPGSQELKHRGLAVKVKCVQWGGKNDFSNEPRLASVGRAFKQVMAAGRASPVPTAALSPLMWGSVASPCTRLRVMPKCIPTLVQCINAALYFDEFVHAHLTGPARQMDKELCNKKERGKMHLRCTWRGSCAQPCTVSLQSYPN